MILGMDWLSANHVMLNYSDRTIVFTSILPSESIIPVNLYLSSSSIDCCEIESQRYVLLSMNVLEFEQKLNQIPVVREYPDVFQEDISKSPKKE